MDVNGICDIFKKHTDYKFVNKLNDKKLRNSSKGITLENAVFYRLSYSAINSTQQSIVSKLNIDSENVFTREAYLKKESNISVDIYRSILNDIINLYNKSITNNDLKRIAVDGTYNVQKDSTFCLNMGYYDTMNNVPLDLTINKHARVGEVNQLIKYISENKKLFENVIIIADRLYSNYKLINFLIINGIKFIIRLKNNLVNPESKINSENIRILNKTVLCDKTVNCTNKRKGQTKAKIKYVNRFQLITNLSNTYTENTIYDIYESRWDIEVYFKFLKYNFKFSKMTEKSIVSYEKNYICSIIISYLVKMIIAHSRKLLNKQTIKNNKDSDINTSNIVTGVYDSLLKRIVNGTLNENELNNFCKAYVVKIYNKQGRHFPRFSKTPYDKWYLKGYSESSAYSKIISKFLEKKIHELNKNLKNIFYNIIEISVYGRTYKINNKARLK